MHLPLKQKLFYFFPVLFCFCMPFGSLLLSGIVAIWTFLSFFVIDKEQFLKGLKNKFFIVPSAFFLFTLLSALFSENKSEAMFAIEVKLTLLLFPYLLFCFKWPLHILKRCVISFVSGCFFACLYLIARAFIYASNGQPEYFFYSLFSNFIHASYFAMYLILAITFVLVLYPKWFSSQKSIIYSSYFFIAIFITCIFLCSSKLGLISFFICVPILVLYRLKEYLSLQRTLLVFGAVLVMLVVSIILFPGPFQRMKSIGSVSMEHLDKTSVESTTVRILIWKECIGLIRQHPVLGTGVGDANDALYTAYEEHGMTGAFEHRFNAHNQYFQTLIGLGIAGFIFLFLLTIGLLILAIRQKKFLLIIFSLLIVLNFAVESMLQTSAGILFFMFFYSLFNLVGEKELLEIIPDRDTQV